MDRGKIFEADQIPMSFTNVDLKRVHLLMSEILDR